MNFVLVEALTFGLGRLVKAAEELNVTLHLLTYNPDIYFYELDKIDSSNLKLIKLNTFNQDDIINYCTSIEDFGGIINLTDTWTNSVREISEILGCKGQNPKSTTICRDKSMLREVLSKKGLSKGKQSLVKVHEAFNTSNIDYPVIIKDPSGTGSKHVWFADCDEEFYSVIETIKNKSNLELVLVESYFKGTLYSAETVSYQGETKLISVSSRVLSDIPLFMEKAISLPLDIEKNGLEHVEPWIKSVLSAISYTDGFAHTEFIVTDDSLEVVEVNPRLGGVQIGEALCQAFDYNIYKAFIEIALGVRPEIFSMELVKKKSLGQVFIYANTKGSFANYNERNINHKTTTIYPCAKIGKKIENLHDQSACVAILLTEAANSEVALLNALSEANKIQILMEE